MITRRVPFVIALLFMLVAAAASVRAQQPQIPTLQVCNQTGAAGRAVVVIDSRKDAAHQGRFSVMIDLTCDPAGSGYPAGRLEIRDISMSDSIAQGTIVASTFEQVTTTGKHTPTVFINGRCNAGNVPGCRYWMMIADNKGPNVRGTPDIISFLVFDRTGKRMAYGTGPVVEGDIDVKDTPN